MLRYVILNGSHEIGSAETLAQATLLADKWARDHKSHTAIERRETVWRSETLDSIMAAKRATIEILMPKEGDA